MEPSWQDIVGMGFALIFIVYLIPLGLNGFSGGLLTAENESEQFDYYNTLSDADKANYTSDYAEDGEPPTPWGAGEYSLLSVVGIIVIIKVVRGMNE